MLVQLRRAAALTLVMVVLCLVYTFVETGVAQVLFKSRADGSMTANGSTMIGQSWTGPKWFQGRDDPDNPLSSGPTSYGPRSNLLYAQVQKEVALLKKEGITPTNGLVTGSGSGLDPDIAPADADAQVDAVARANGLPVAAVQTLVNEHVAGAYLGIFGAPYVDVLQLNGALASLVASRHAS